MSMPRACCTLPPVNSDYEPQGDLIKIGDLDVYETKDKTPSRVIICAYDIFGFHNVTKQVADILSQAGFRVVMPDFFRGASVPNDLFGGDRTKIMAWVAENGSWENRVKNDLAAVISHYKEKEGISGHSFGIYGMCWGGRVALDAITTFDEIQAAALVHPAFWKTEDAEAVKKPTLLLPSTDEEDMLPFYEILKKNVGEDNCGHRRFDEIFHGFAGARGDLSNELNRKLIDEAVDLMQNFFRKHVKSAS